MNKIKTVALLVFTLAFLLAAVACGAPQQQADATQPVASGPAAPSPSAQEEESAPAAAQPSESGADSAVQNGWTDSDIPGSVTADTQADLKDDFHLAVNKDWLAAAEIPAGQMQVSSFTERNKEVMDEIMALIKDESQDSHEARLVQRLYNDYVDMDARNALGMEPVMPLVEDIRNIETLDGLTSYLVENNKIRR